MRISNRNNRRNRKSRATLFETKRLTARDGQMPSQWPINTSPPTTVEGGSVPAEPASVPESGMGMGEDGREPCKKYGKFGHIAAKCIARLCRCGLVHVGQCPRDSTFSIDKLHDLSIAEQEENLAGAISRAKSTLARAALEEELDNLRKSQTADPKPKPRVRSRSRSPRKERLTDAERRRDARRR